jgi:UDP-N-acetylglucosamine acyltransferase
MHYHLSIISYTFSIIKFFSSIMNSHPLSVIHEDAKIGKNVKIGPFCNIAADVEIGDNCTIEANVSIMRGVRMSNNCHIFQGAIVGSIPQDLKYKGEPTELHIGAYTQIREYCTVNIGTLATGKTVIGSRCLVMAYAHVAHDCIIGDNVILANNVTLAGHIEIGDFARLGGMVAVHQFVKIGHDAFIGGGSLVPRDVPPYVLAARTPLSYAGVNKVGLERRKFSPDQINAIRDIYRILFVRGLNMTEAVKLVQETLPDSHEKTEILDFVANSSRGLIKGFRSVSGK